MDLHGNPGNNVLYLLGAGASKGAGLKTSVELLTSIDAWSKYQEKNLRLALEVLSGTLRRLDAGANVEDLVESSKSIRNRKQSFLWSVVEGFQEPLRSLEERCPEILDRLPHIILDRIRTELYFDDSRDCPYLSELINLAGKSATPCIFTLNYDLTIESTLEKRSIPYATGFIKPLAGNADSYMLPDLELWPVGYQRALVGEDMTWFTPDFREANFRLIKLHGSLDWFRVAMQPIYEGGLRISPQDRIVRLRTQPEVESMEMMIVGRSGKKRTEEPFSILLREFHLAVQRADVVVVIGYSFSDEHINRILIDAQVFERPRSFDLVVVNGPHWPSNGIATPTMSNEAQFTWSILWEASNQSRAENLWGITILNEHAEQAILGRRLERKIEEILDVRHNGL